jgi:SAM-dependent methyltransferase
VLFVTREYELPSDAVPYILLQRMDTQKFRELRYLIPFGRTIYNTLYNKFFYKLEALLREEDIKQQFRDEMHEEFQSIEPYLPDNTTSVLDVGCGVGGIDLFLSDYYEDQQPIFYLFDKTEISDSVYYQFRNQSAFYNSLEVAAESLQRNGMDEKNIHTLDADQFDLSKLKQVDLCISLISWAFHYPLDTYLDDVLRCLSEDGSLILDFRRETGQLETAWRFFEDHQFIKTTDKFHRVILRNPLKSKREEFESKSDQEAISV